MIINKYDTQQNKYCFSTKLGEYLSFAKPIIITDIGEAMHYLNETNSFIVKAGSSQEIAEKIIHIVLNEQDAINKGKEGYKLAKEIFNYKYQSKRIIPFFKTIIES